MINEAINKLAEKQNLTGAETIGAFGEIMSGEATNAQIAAFITAMRMKGETIEEITACAKVLREKCTHIDPGKDVLDIVGTGGDCANTFNISTTSSFVIAAAGVPVAKHGNRSVSSKSGAADVLEELGVKIDWNPHGFQYYRPLGKSSFCQSAAFGSLQKRVGRTFSESTC